MTISASLYEDVLRVSVHNRPGANHEMLLAAVSGSSSSSGSDAAGATTNDLLSVRRQVLEGMGCGSDQSTFQGLHEMRTFAEAFRPPAETHLWVRPDGVLFELHLHVSVAPPVDDETETQVPHSLPEGLAFVCCDDDEIPRIVAGSLIAQAAADETESLILGDTYDEVTGLVESVLAVAARLGDERVVCVLDENIDGYQEGSFTGTQLIGKLRGRGFRGLMIVQSANDDPADEKNYLAAGADGSFGKAVRGGIQEKLDTLGRLYHARFGPQGYSGTV